MKHRRHIPATRTNGLTVAAVVMWLCACSEPLQTLCSDDLVCPPSKKCDGHGGCALPEQLEGCAGKDDGSACSYTATSGERVDGACTGQLCLPIGCGNAIVQPTEVCDDGNNESGDGCSADCRSDERCGNASVDPARGEQCDDGNIVDGDGCQHDCQDPTCGDGVVDAVLGELCDLGSGNSRAPDATCRPTCQPPRCGDGVTDPGRGEVCDDGNLVSGDGCVGNCTSDESCGNGIVDVAAGEVCDDGNTTSTDGCRGDCRSNETCGNGVLDMALGELCDDGNVISGDGCSADCRSLEVCGNGIVDTFAEECDLGGANADTPNSPCRTNCKVPACGDDIVDDTYGEACDEGGANSNGPSATCRINCQPQRCSDGITDPLQREVCDDGNVLPGDGCSADCGSDETCGNEIIDVVTGEQCDEGGNNSNLPNAACRTTCRLPRCGDGITDPVLGEACDEGMANSDAPDAACRTSCQPKRCGDDVLDSDELCDDGNVASGDGCSATCLSDETCGNGIVDVATGEQCDAAANNSNAPNAPCRTSCKLPSCGDGIIDSVLGESCDLGAANSNLPDATCRTNCQPQRCGDDILDAGKGEACDDGNVTAGDGCSIDCLSDETCGNSFVDVTLGEQCDDGNPLARDGCSACQPEDAAMVDIGLPAPGVNSHAMAYDAARQRVVVFGGYGAFGGGCGAQCASNETWEWDGVSWTRLQPRHRPPRRSVHAMAYDPIRRRVVLFGGFYSYLGVTYYGDTWAWDGNDWTQLQPATAPSPRQATAMAFDANRGTIILYGGYSETGPVTDTWEWDGTTWRQLTVTGAPGARYYHRLAYDAARNRLVMFGGLTSGVRSDRTWLFDGTTATWIDMGVATGVLASTSSPYVPYLAYDAKRAAVVLWSNEGTTWEWTGAAWTASSEPGPTDLELQGAMAYDAAREQLVAIGGTSGSTWLRGEAPWGLAPAWIAPPARMRAAAAYDPARGKVVLFGGQTAYRSSNTPRPNTLNDTWEWDGRRWTSIAASTPPSSRAGASADYSSSTGEVMLFGGGTFDTTRTWYADLYAYDGTAWRVPLPSTVRPGLVNSAMAYDAGNDQVVTFGGATPAKANVQETWTWDASDGWVQRAPAAKPPARRNHVLGYDPLRGRTVVFGGTNGALPTDTWEWDGTTWHPITTTTAPPGRVASALVYNPDARKLVLYGNNTQGLVEDLWEWSGTRWSQVPLANPPVDNNNNPAKIYRAATAYDAARHGMVVFGGRGPNLYTVTATTRLIRYRANASFEACSYADLDYDRDGLAGCADPECWSVCAPMCPPGATSCPSGPRCGDMTCDAPLENCNICPGDCGACAGPAVCGDFRCTSGETTATCKHDCF